MKRISCILMVLLLLLPAACRKYKDQLTPQEEYLVGSWEYDKVTVNRGVFNNDNLTGDYSDHKLHFYDDFKLDYEREGQLYSGKWRLDNVRISDNDGNSNTEYRLLLMLNVDGEIEDHLWENASVSRNRVSASEYVRAADERYSYRLEKAN